jgi:hypothetical protein
MASSSVRVEVLNRLVLAKQFLRAAEGACAIPNDQWAFARGVMLLHDAAESALASVADHFHAIKDPQKNVYLLQYCELIQKADPQNKAAVSRHVPYQIQLRTLNTLRNVAKHAGILPDQKSNAHFPSTIGAFITEIAQTYLGLSFADVNLTSLIRDETIRGYIQEAEGHREAGNHGDALTSLAYAMYHIIDSAAVPWSVFDRFLPSQLYKKKTARHVFPNFHDVNHTVRLIEHGIDPHLHSRFHLLTPTVGKDTEGGQPVYRWEKEFGHPGNWTEQNVSFCLNFCIDAALRCQRDDGNAYSLIRYSSLYEDVIEPVGDQATIWNISSDTSDYFPRTEPYKREPILVITPGESIIGEVTDDPKKPHEWHIFFRGSLKGGKEDVHFGYVAKKEVKVKTRGIALGGKT